METNNFNQDERIHSAFNCICEMFEKGQPSKAFTYFSNTVKTEIELTIEDELNNTLVLNQVEAGSE
ncbi:MAG: hypothetical protein OEX07_15545 [Gammaproteobacteria bacterium]|nr:hypothetical protein [Gammaproteobacteria bacterium]